MAVRIDWKALQRVIAGEVLLRETGCLSSVEPPFTAWFAPEPQAVVRCRTPSDVTEVLAFARRHSFEIAARCGGHCYAASSSTDGVVIDVTPMSSVHVADELCTVGAGTRIGDIVEFLCQHELAIPTGVCPTVGITGLTLGGGFGMLGRSRGLTSDQLVGAQVVLADGSLLACDAGHDEDLFWALRGAGGGNFGVVTSLTFNTGSAPQMTDFQLTWPFADANSVVAAWQRWAPTGPDQLVADLVLTTSSDLATPPSVAVHGALIGRDSVARELLDALVSLVGSEPLTRRCSESSYRDSCAFQASLIGGQTQGSVRKRRFTKSEFFGRPLAYDAISTLLKTLIAGCGSGVQRTLEFAAWGGAYNRVAPDATAFAHREQLFTLEHTVSIQAGASEAETRSAREWVKRSWSTVHSCGSGFVYPNFRDPELTDFGRAYYGANYPRLLEIKAKYDPDNTFRFGQSLPCR